MKPGIIALILGMLFLVGCDDGGPEDKSQTIMMQPLPEGIGSAWVLTGPDGYSLSDTGSVVLEDLEIGEYSVSWDDVTGWRNTPADETRTLQEDSTVVFVGAYNDDLQEADTEDKLMENFEVIYTEMSIDDFLDMLHDDFRMILLHGTISDWGWAPGTTFDDHGFNIIHTNMFGGASGTDHEGNGIAPLDRIEISLFERIGEWATVDQNDIAFPGTRRALYEIKIFFHDNTGTHAFAVDSQIICYAASIDGIWYLRGLRPLDGKATEEFSYDSILSLYR